MFVGLLAKSHLENVCFIRWSRYFQFMLREYLILEVATQRLEGKNARQGRMAGAEKNAQLSNAHVAYGNFSPSKMKKWIYGGTIKNTDHNNSSFECCEVLDWKGENKIVQDQPYAWLALRRQMLLLTPWRGKSSSIQHDRGAFPCWCLRTGSTGRTNEPSNMSEKHWKFRKSKTEKPFSSHYHSQKKIGKWTIFSLSAVFLLERFNFSFLIFGFGVESWRNFHELFECWNCDKN